MAPTGGLTELVESMRGRVDPVDAPVVVGLSGGADSAALLWLLVETGAVVRAVHVIHGLPASPLMATAAGQVAALLGVDLSMRTVDPPARSEDALRTVRHDALLAEAGDDELVALAHTADDQAETVLLRIIRGTGPSGIAAMSVRRNRIVRPFLAIRRAETRQLASLAGLPFRDDPANVDPASLRNRVRAELLPLIDELADGHAVVRLTRLAELSAALPEPGPPPETEWRSGTARVPLGTIRSSSDPAGVVRAVVRTLDPPYPPDRAATDRVVEVAMGEARSAEVRAGLVARPEGPFLVIGPPDRPSTDWGEVELVDGTTVAGFAFAVRPVDLPAAAPTSMRRLVVPAEARLAVRPWREGDRVAGRRVEAALADHGVPAVRRPGWPLVVLDDEPVWIPGVRRRVWSREHIGRYLDVTASEDPPWQTSEH